MTKELQLYRNSFTEDTYSFSYYQNCSAQCTIKSSNLVYPLQIVLLELS